MGVAEEIQRLKGVQEMLSRKMREAGYPVTGSMRLDELADMLELSGREDPQNILPDTDTWVMSNGSAPERCGGYGFEAAFHNAWEGFTCFFDAGLVEKVRGRQAVFGVSSLEGRNARLELIVDGAFVNGIYETAVPKSVTASIPEAATSVSLRIIMFGAEDLHCSMEGVFLRRA